MRITRFVMMCTGFLASASANAADTTNVSAVIKGLDNPFFQYMRQGIEEQAKVLGVNVSIQAAANMGDATGQADKLTAMAMQDYGCYLVNPISVSNLCRLSCPSHRSRSRSSTSTAR